MDLRDADRTKGSLRRTAAVLLVAAASLAAFTACDSILGVDLPGQVQEQDLDDPAMADALYAGALGEFECAFNALVPTHAFLTGEFISANFFLSSNAWGRRERPFMEESPGACPDSRASTVYGYYEPMQRARWQAEEAAERISGFPDEEVSEKTRKLAALNAYAGYSYLHLGQNYCEVAFDNGPLRTTEEALSIAEDRFTEAIDRAEAAQADEIRNMALVGRARVRLNLDRGSEAVSDAEQVPEGFVRNAEYSTTRVRRENSSFNRTDTDYLSVGADWRDLAVDGEPDPRVPVENTGTVGQDGSTPQWDQLKYSSRSAPIRIASWAEAQMIIAEVEGGEEAIDAMNRVRGLHDLPPLEEEDVDDVFETLMEERRREFFLEGQRHSDMVRHDIDFPSGENHKGQLYQPYDCMPLPNVERDNNPNIGG